MTDVLFKLLNSLIFTLFSAIFGSSFWLFLYNVTWWYCLPLVMYVCFILFLWFFTCLFIVHLKFVCKFQKCPGVGVAVRYACHTDCLEFPVPFRRGHAAPISIQALAQTSRGLFYGCSDGGGSVGPVPWFRSL